MQLQATVEGGWRNKLAYLGLADLQMPIIHTWNVSLNMWNYHVNYRCSSPSHSCLASCAHTPHRGAKYWKTTEIASRVNFTPWE